MDTAVATYLSAHGASTGPFIASSGLGGHRHLRPQRIRVTLLRRCNGDDNDGGRNEECGGRALRAMSLVGPPRQLHPALRSSPTRIACEAALAVFFSQTPFSVSQKTKTPSSTSSHSPNSKMNAEQDARAPAIGSLKQILNAGARSRVTPLLEPLLFVVRWPRRAGAL